MVVQEAGDEGFLAEDELSAKEDPALVFFRHFAGDGENLARGVVGDSGVGFRSESMRAGVPHVTMRAFLGVFAQCFDFVTALEVSGIDHAHLDENVVAEIVPEKAWYIEQRVQAEAVVTVDQDDRGARLDVDLHLGVAFGADELFVARFNDGIEALQAAFRVIIVATDEERTDGEDEGNQ